MSDLSNKLVNGENLELLAQKLDTRFNEKLLLINDIDYETLLAFDTNDLLFDNVSPAGTEPILGQGRLGELKLAAEENSVATMSISTDDNFQKTNFVAGQILKADHLNNIEDGIISNENAISSNAEAISNMARDIAAKQDKLVNGTSIKTINGESILGSGDISIASGGSAESAINYDLNMKAVNHRGYSKGAPENTIPAYIMSKQKGYTYVECDVSFTKDSVAVLLHDSTIDRTSNGSGNIQSLTYEQLLQYDFGSWYSSKFAGTKIPTFKEFIMYCKGLGMHPYIELKSSGGYTESQIRQVVDEVELCGMKGKVTYISFSATFLEYVKAYDEEARLGFLADVKSSTIATANSLKTGKNEVFMDVNYTNVNDSKVALCMANDLPMEVWTVNDANTIKKLNPYISGVTSDNQIAGKILYNLYSTYTNTTYISATSITLNKTNLTFEELKTQTLTATVSPSNASGSVVWKSSNTSVATVSNGIVTPIKDGSCTITASIDSVSASCSITVATAATVYSVTKNLTGCTSTNTAVNVIEGEAYTDTFTHTLGYTLDGATVSITMGGTDISSCYYNGTLNISSVTGDIVVNIVAKEKEIVKYSITRNLTNCTSSSSVTEIIEGESYTETFTPSIEYSLLSSNISITMGGTDITNCYNNRTLTIPVVTGDVVINIKGAKLTSPLIDYTFSSDGVHGLLTNTGTGGATYDTRTVGSFNVVDNKLSLLNGAYASVDYPTTRTGKFTIHIKGSYDSLTGKQYERMYRNDADALCGYYVQNRKNFGIKLANDKSNGGVLHDTSIATWYPDNSNTLNINYNAVGLGTMHDYIYTADGTTIKFYFDGKLMASQNQSALKEGTSFALGNIQNTTNSYNANITVEKWKIFDYAMNSEEVYELVNLKGIEEYTITRILTGCTSSSDTTKILGLQSHTETITVNEGYKMEGAKISITMDGVDISDCYVNGTLTIGSVTGNIFISIEAIDGSWEVVRTLGQDDLQLIQLNKNAPSYTNSGSTRVSYPAFDLFFEKGYIYKFDTQVADPSIEYNMGVQCYTEADYENMTKGSNLANIYDPGWQELGLEMTPPTSYNNSPIKGYRITFRKASNANIKATDIVSVTIMRKQINYTNVIKTIEGSDLVFGNLKTTQQSATGGYYVADNTRLSYVNFDIPMTTGKTYKFVYTSTIPLKIGVQSHTKANVDSINSGGTPTLSVTDYKWHDNEYECTMLVANTGGCRITFCDASNIHATLTGDEITQVIIYEY
jgi:glycerophosphoryl diester phosphodiesterase